MRFACLQVALIVALEAKLQLDCIPVTGRQAQGDRSGQRSIRGAPWGTAGMELGPGLRVPGEGVSLSRAGMATWCTQGPGSTSVSFHFLMALKDLKT